MGVAGSASGAARQPLGVHPRLDAPDLAHLDPAGTRPAELARRLGTSRQAVHELVGGLCRAGVLDVVPDRAAILAATVILFLTGIPISVYAARHGVDIDLLTRGAGFGYIGSTITSLIYASFTFIFFALEAAIMAMALEMLFGVPLVLGYLICAVVIIPLVIHGITTISRFQVWTQPAFIFLQLVPFVFIVYADASSVSDWTQFEGLNPVDSGGFSIVMFGAAAAVVLPGLQPLWLPGWSDARRCPWHPRTRPAP